MTLVEALQFMRGSGTNAAVGIIISFMIEWFPEWATLDGKLKRVIMLALCLTLPLLATVGLILLNQPGLMVDDPELWWQALVAGMAAFSSNQVAHLRKLE